MDLQNKSDLETYIDAHESSKLRPLLVDINLQNDFVDEAIANCQKIITEDPGSPYGYYLLALAEIKTNELDNAVEHLKQTIDLDYGFLDAYNLLVEIGKDKLNPGSLKACYEKIAELNPFDDNAKTESGRISEEADREALKNITLPEIKVHKTISRVAAPEPEVEEEPEPVTEIEAEAEPEPITEPEPRTTVLAEEEAHLGPMIPAEDESDVEPPAEPEQVKKIETEPAPAPEPVPPTPAEPPAPEPAKSAETPVAATEENPQPQPATVTGTPTSALNDMFAKLKSKPLEEVQKENWSLPVVEAPAPPPKPDDLVQKPNIKFTIPLKDKVDSKKKLEEIHKEIGLAAAVNLNDAEKKKKPAKTAEKSNEVTAPDTNKPGPSKSSPKSPKADGNRVELKIPVPTFTLVEVFKNQKLYDEALQLLDVLEKKSKNPERIDKERAEILKLKMDEE